MGGEAGQRRHPGGSLLRRRRRGAAAWRPAPSAAPASLRPWDFNRRPLGDNSFIEDYTAEIRGAPVGAIHLITFNADGEAQHIIVNYRPLSSLMFFSRLLREKFAGTPYAEHYLAGEV